MRVHEGMKHKNKNSKQERRRLQVLKAVKKYKTTFKGKKTAEKYEKSEKGKNRTQKYQNSEKGVKALKRVQKKRKAKRELQYYKKKEEDPTYKTKLRNQEQNNTEWWQRYQKRLTELQHEINS